MQFHHSHYDWWTFPYGCHTSSYGAAYAIYEHEVELLKQDWLIRLYKCARSLKLFGFAQESYDIQRKNFGYSPSIFQGHGKCSRFNIENNLKELIMIITICLPILVYTMLGKDVKPLLEDLKNINWRL